MFSSIPVADLTVGSTMSRASENLDGSAEMEVSDQSGDETSGGDKSPPEDTRRVTTCPPVEISRRLQYTLSGSISCPVYPTSGSNTIIATENLTLHLSEEHGARSYFRQLV